MKNHYKDIFMHKYNKLYKYIYFKINISQKNIKIFSTKYYSIF